MSSDQPVPLIDVRGIGPSLVPRLEQCGIGTANQLADMTVAEFKERCPVLAKKGEGLVKGARRLLKRRDIAQAIASSDAISVQELTTEETPARETESGSVIESDHDEPVLMKRQKKIKTSDKKKKSNKVEDAEQSDKKKKHDKKDDVKDKKHKKSKKDKAGKEDKVEKKEKKQKKKDKAKKS